MLSKVRNKLSTVMVSIVVSSFFLAQGCVFLIVPIIAAYSDDGITVTVEVPRSAPDVFAAGLKRVESGISESGIPYNITNIDEENYSISLEGTDGTWQADFVVVPISARVSQIIGTGTDDNREKEESENLVLMGIKSLCDDLGVRYDVITRDVGDDDAK